MSNIKLSLIENAHDFLNHSLSQAIVAEESAENWKYAILHLVQAIELSLKDRLRREHPSLIYRNIDKPKETVSLEYAAGRLQKLANAKFKEKDLEIISLASDYRNQIVHYEFSFRKEEIKSIYATLLGFLQSFTNIHYGKQLDEIIEEEIWKEAVQILEYAKELQVRAEERFKSENIDSTLIIKCRRCYQQAFVIQDDIETCYVCGKVDDIVVCSACQGYFYYDEVESLGRDSDDLYCEKCYDEYFIP